MLEHRVRELEEDASSAREALSRLTSENKELRDNLTLIAKEHQVCCLSTAGLKQRETGQSSHAGDGCRLGRSHSATRGTQDPDSGVCN